MMTEQERIEQRNNEAKQQIQSIISESGLPGPVGETVVYNKGGRKIIHEISVGKNGGWNDIYKCCTKREDKHIKMPLIIVGKNTLTGTDTLGESY